MPSSHYSHKYSEEDLVKEKENKLAPIELNTSSVGGLVSNDIINRSSSTISLQKNCSVRTLSHSHDEKDLSLQ